MQLPKKTLAILGAIATLGAGGTLVADNAANPYTDKADRVEMLTVADVPDAGEQKVELIKSRPEVRFKKWNGEVDLGLTYSAVKGAGNRPLLSNKMEYKDAKQEVHAYPLTDGFEIEVILKEKPDTNVVTFTLDNWQGLNFFYQPALTQQEIDEGAERPDNVVGSYAVYAKEKANHVVGQTNYATGKIGHIFRPKIIDSAGTEVWGELHIANGILSVTIPQDFLDKAVYPVRHAAGLTFGYTTAGGTSATLNANQALGSFLNNSVSVNGTVDKITAYLEDNADSSRIKGFVTDAGPTTWTILTNGVGGIGDPLGNDPVWTDSIMSVPPSVSASTNYIPWLVFNGSTLVYRDAGTSGDSRFESDNNYTTPTNPNTLTNSTGKYSIYATYTASAAAGPNIQKYQLLFEE